MTPKQQSVVSQIQSQWVREYERVRDIILPPIGMCAGPLEMSFTDLSAYGCFRGADAVVTLKAEYVEIDSKAHGELRRRTLTIGPRGKLSWGLQGW